ncbi:Trafficking protein particle complex subunit 4 [Binucleata daphniae]
MDLQIINKSGCLIFSFQPNQSNTNLIFASSLHTIYAHIMEIQTFNCFESDLPLFVHNKNTVLSIYKTLNGHTFVFTDTKKIDETVYKKVANLFIDYALKNPFYSHLMPVNCSKFRDNVSVVISNIK